LLLAGLSGQQEAEQGRFAYDDIAKDAAETLPAGHGGSDLSDRFLEGRRLVHACWIWRRGENRNVHEMLYST